jgi:hypothetical protein
MSDVQPVASPNNNKTVGSVSGGFSGAALGTALIALMDLKYPNLSNIATAAIASCLTAIIGGVGTFLAPLLTAAQHRAVKALDGNASEDQKEIMTIGKAQATLAAASKPTQPST